MNFLLGNIENLLRITLEFTIKNINKHLRLKNAKYRYYKNNIKRI